MPDVVTPTTRSRMMSGIRSRNTRPELVIRRGLHAHGYRYRLHIKHLPGTPDLVFPSRRAVIFVHGCFWHGHDCHLFHWPSTRSQWWREKIETNQARDAAAVSQLSLTGWRVAHVWECALKGSQKREASEVIESLATWLEDGEPSIVIKGTES